MEYNNLDRLCLDYYNSMYNSHINNVPYSIFINNFIDKMINTLGIDRAGFIAQYKPSINSLYNTNVSRKNIKNSKDQFDVSYSPIMSLDNEDCLLKECIATKSIVYKTDVTYKHIFGSLFDTQDVHLKINTILLPILFGNDTKGILGFITTTNIKTEIINEISSLQHLLGTLLYSVEMSGKISKDTYSSNKFLVYQVLVDILNLTSDGIIVLNNKYNISYYNEITDVMFKETIPDLNENDIIDCYIADIIPAFHSVICSNKQQYFKNKQLSFRKGYYDVIAYINSIVMGTDICHVITMKKKEERPSSPQTLKSTKNLIAYLSHELRNPIQAISNGCFVLQAEFDSLPQKEQDILKESSDVLCNMNRNCKDMGVIIDDILDLSKLDAKEFYINLDVCQIDELMETILIDFKSIAEDKDLTLISKIEDSTPKTLYTDETRIYQILSNLVSNSIKYSDSGTISINVSFDSENHGIKFKISDEGQGIRSTEVSNLFKDFGQTSNSFCNKSTGLGLCVSQKIANVLGGNITVETQYKKGSVFTLFHPIKLGSSGSRSNEDRHLEPIKGKILIVDDEVQNASIFKMLLMSFNYKYGYDLCVDLVFSGESAIDTIKNCNNYDLIFMDINMEGIDGCTTCQILRSKHIFNGPIIATTGNIMANEVNRDKDDGKKFDSFTNILIKPFNFDQILSTLSTYVGTTKIKTN